MVSYRIAPPRKQKDVTVVDIIEYHGGSIWQRTTVRLDQITPFIKSVFHELPDEYKELLEGKK